MQLSASEGEKGNWRWSWVQCVQPSLQTSCGNGELLAGWAVVGWAWGPRHLRGCWGPPMANGSQVQCHFGCTRLPPGAGSPPDGGDRQPDGELPGVGRMWDPFCRFSVGNLPMWDREEPGFLQIVVLASILTVCLLWVLRLVREIRLMFLLLSCLARKIIGIGCLGLFSYYCCQTKIRTNK